MTDNKPRCNGEQIKIKDRQIKVAELTMSGVPMQEIGRILGVSRSTAWRDWQKIRSEEQIQAAHKEMIAITASNAIKGSLILNQYVEDMLGKKLKHYEATAIEGIVKVCQKISQDLKGELTDDTGGSVNPYKSLMDAIAENSSPLDD